MANQEFRNIMDDLTPLVKKLFGENAQVLENIYSPICAEIRVQADMLQMDQIEGLLKRDFKISLICKNNLGFILHVFYSRNALKEMCKNGF